MASPAYQQLSLWHATIGEDWVARPALPGDRDFDVVIVGGGFTGLWTAYYLAAADKGLRIAVLEAEVCGFGASGRNGGWCSALFPASLAKLAALSDPDSAKRMQRAMNATIDEVGAVVAAEKIDCDYSKGGTIVLARTPSQLARAKASVADSAAWGFADLELLSAAEATARLNASEVLGATYTPHCARIQPARLVRSLARVVERMGVQIFEKSAVSAIEPGRAVTANGVVRAAQVLRATEGFTPTISGYERAIAPVYSLMVATDPLPESVWEQIGLWANETFSDFRHLIIYGQRTSDGRFAFGGRGAPYHFRSSIKPAYDRVERVFADLRATLVSLFPMLHGVGFSHVWGGPLGISRDWCASVSLDRRTGVGYAGGYVGDGVSTTNLAGRTLRDLVLGVESDLTTLPWVNHHSRRWEPEPLRWLGVNAGLRVMTAADREESITGRQSLLARAMSGLTGGH